MSCELTKKIKYGIIIVLLVALYPAPALDADELLQAQLADGVVIKVLADKEAGAVDTDYAREVLQAACAAYEDIIYTYGFNRRGYTFASASRFFAYDGDKTIEIYITPEVEGPFALCQSRGGLEFQAQIFIPADYRAYREKYKIAQPYLELKASLTHELLHIVTYSYNRNMQTSSAGKANITAQRWDWYIEGLARYFEALAGYRKEFLSAGFRKSYGDKVMVYKGGVNYFLKYPDKPLDERKYDFALFWQYLDQNYGMDRIEEISVRFRQLDPKISSNLKAMEIIAEVVGVSLENLLQDFSLYLYEISSVSARKEEGLRAVHSTKLLSDRNQTIVADISGFGYDFYEVDIKEGLESVELNALNSRNDLSCQVGVFAGTDFMAFAAEADYSGKVRINTAELPKKSKIILMLSNPHPETVSYRISLN